MLRPHDATGLAGVLEGVDDRGVIARGLGRSYGDAAQNAGGHVVDTRGVSGLISVDLEAGVARAHAGTSLDDLMRWLVPLGWFVPVTPGTRQVTVGGAIAADIHGKNHHRHGSWCRSVRSITLLTPSRGVVTVGPDQDADLFWATAGGMGLTGVVLDATFTLSRIETSRLLVDTDRTPDLDATLDLMATGDHAYDYSVAWIDLVADGAALGRSILSRGRFAKLDELDRRSARDPLAFSSGTIATAPPIFPSGLLNNLSVRAFNEVWYRKAPRRARGDLQTITQFFHPLDLVDDWNRIYGRRGFLQWQCLVPLDAVDDLRWMVHRLATSGRSSFLAVLKRCGPGNPGHLSFPAEGWTLALDIPAESPDALGALLDDLDDRVVAVGGRDYLAKDSRLRPEYLAAMYPRLDEWREVVASVDPDRVLVSDLARRLHLHG
jgi:decaprenylphospho-beta-D-ribofuranose 2-oxidase